MKLRGTIKPPPQYTPDLRGLIAWLGQPPSSFSSVGWHNAQEWQRALNAFMLKSTVDVVKATRERDEARRMYCRGFVALSGCYDDDSLKHAAMKVAQNLGWDCFDGHEGEVNP